MREERKMRLEEAALMPGANFIALDDEEESDLQKSELRDLTERQKERVREMKKAMEKGVFDHGYRGRSYTKRATPFMFPDAYSINQQVFSHAQKQKSSISSGINSQQQDVHHSKPPLDARLLHREQFWSYLNREEILLHDHASWQKLAQIEENFSAWEPRNEADEVVVEPPISAAKKRETKAFSKLLKRTLGRSKETVRRQSATSVTCGREQILKQVFEKATEGYKFNLSGIK